MSKVTSQDIIDEISTQWEAYIQSTGQDVENARSQMASFLADVEPDIETALASSDLTSLSYIEGRLKGAAGRISLGLIYRQTNVALALIRAVITVVIKFGIASL